MRSSDSTRGVTRAMLAGLLASGLVLVGCTASSSDDGDDPAPNPGPAQNADGVSFGASIEEYREAFAEVEPITLRFQTEAAQGSLNAAGRQAYGDALEEWSDGRITIEWGYGASFVPNALEWAPALSDGRIDVSYFLPYYNPDVYPLLSDLTTATLLDGNRPTSTLLSSAWLTDAVVSLPGYLEEAESGGVHILANTPSGNIPGIFCKNDISTLQELDGVLISASGAGRVAQLTALGFAPQSIAFTELYEALERNVVECGSSVLTNLDTIGATELTPHIVADPEASLVGFPSFIAVGKEKWDMLPLVAQQLMHDRLDVLFGVEPVAQSQRNASILEQVRAAGGDMRPLGADARAVLLSTNEDLLTSLGAGGADIDTILGIFDSWRETIDENLYPELDSSIEVFLADGAYDDIDLQPWIDAFFSEILLERRPG